MCMSATEAFPMGGALTMKIFTLIVATLPAFIVNGSPTLDSLQTEIDDLTNSFNGLKEVVTTLSRQTMLQQFGVEERTRMDSNSGLKVIRNQGNGLKNYESASHVGSSVNAIHEHANYFRTMGMGEVSVVMNGINFRSRHNDYKLVMPSTTSREFRATEQIPFPKVPPSVTGTIEEQVKEMTEWFKAFKNQDYSKRDYREYFKPILCYMEGTWTLDKDLQEPFSSDRHHIDASSWFELQEKDRFATYTGSKDNDENLAYLPTSIISVNGTTGVPNYAQWNYRILCKPTPKYIPLSMLKYVEDLVYRMRDGITVEQTVESRAARFKLFDENQSNTYQMLDELFYDIPGADNIPFDNLTQATLKNEDIFDVAHAEQLIPLKTGYYHRQYRYLKKGAMGQTINPRGFNDENLWVAQTSQNRVAPVSVKVCENESAATDEDKNCKYVLNRFSYAIPLEIIYLTPLLTWNPHDLEIHDDFESSTANGEDGWDKPYNGVDQCHFYLTPYEMFAPRDGLSQNAADSAEVKVKIMDKNKTAHTMVASGTKIVLEEIPGVGRVRLRYPIAPIADEGGSVWKELNALKDLVQAMEDKIEEIAPSGKPEEVEPKEVFFKMSPTSKSSPGPHTHELAVPYKVFKNKLLKGKVVLVSTIRSQGHTHTLRLKYVKANKTFKYLKCDGESMCWDDHPRKVFLMTNNKFTQLP